MKDTIYNQIKQSLIENYKSCDDYSIAVYLAKLGASPDSVYKYLYLEAKHYDENLKASFHGKNLCYLYRTSGFRTIFYKIAPDKWITYCSCLDSIISDSIYEQRNQEAENRIKVKEDSSKFDKNLLKILKNIEQNDQRYRTEINIAERDFGEKSLLAKNLWQKQKELDEDNLEKTEELLSKFGYIGKSLVGNETSQVLWLVLHHTPDIRTHKKYLPILEKAVEKGELEQGALEVFKYRIQNSNNANH